MKPEQLKSITELRVAEVVVKDRLRPVSEAGVEAMISSIGELGMMKDPITVRKMKDGSFVLMAGAHRLEAAKRLDWQMIPASVWRGSNDWARMVEIDDNLAGAEMNALDTAVFLAERKSLYERMHPEAAADAFRGNQYTGKVASDTMSFATVTAEKFGISKRQVERLTRAGSALGAIELSQLRATPKPVTLKDLGEIASCKTPDERAHVVLAMAGGNAKNAAQARKQWAVEQHGAPPAKSPVEADFARLKDAFNRAQKRAKRRFVEEYLEELRALIADAEEGRTE